MAKKQPPFKTEAKEAEWWAENQNRGTVARVARERASQAGASPTITIRLPEGRR
jgi:hypothetical protein